MAREAGYSRFRSLLTGKVRGETPPEGSRLANKWFASVLTDANFTKIEALESWAKEHDRTVVEVALSWLASQPVVGWVIRARRPPNRSSPTRPPPRPTSPRPRWPRSVNWSVCSGHRFDRSAERRAPYGALFACQKTTKGSVDDLAARSALIFAVVVAEDVA